MRQQVWAGVDAGKSDHHCVAIDAEGQRLLSQRVANDETALLELIDAVTALADGGEVTWAIDLNAGGAALLVTLLIASEQRLLYIPGRTIYHASAGQNLAATMVARLAKEVMTLDTEIGDTETMIEDRFRRHRHAEIILSMPGFGVVLGAEFIAATGGDMNAFDSVDRLAGVSGLAPVPRDSGRISGNLKRPRRYDRRLLRACYLSAQIAIRTDAASRTYYDRKRSEGKTHTQAVLALARRRLNVLWAMLRDHRAYQPTAPNAAAA